MRRECKEFFKGYPVARDYDVKECIKQNENLQIEYKGDIMTLTPEELRSKVVDKSNNLPSKFGGKEYRLLCYEWNPDKVEL